MRKYVVCDIETPVQSERQRGAVARCKQKARHHCAKAGGRDGEARDVERGGAIEYR